MTDNKDTKWSERIVDSRGLEQIHDAVVDVESRVGVEIVPMIVRSSAMTGHVRGYLFLLLLLGFWTVFLFAPMDDVNMPAWAIDALAVVVSIVLAFQFSRFEVFHRLLTPHHDQEASVHHRSLLEFYLSRIQATQKRTGILLFVSALERRAVILCDERIAEKFASETWANIVDVLVAQIRDGHFTQGMTQAIEAIGKILERDFPLDQTRAQHELTDRLIIKS